jgi:hypothetical protein
MNFNDLMAKMRELDQPVPETIQPTIDAPVEECGEPMGMTPSMSPEKETNPPSMSVNISAQGMDDISELMALLTKVNPDMINQPAKPELSLTAPGMSMDRPELPPLKMLPDFDADNNKAPGGEIDIDPMQKAMGDVDGDGDHDMDDHDAEKKSKEKDEAFGNSLDDSEPEVRSVDYMNNQLAGGMNRPKGTHPKVAGGDNPMQKVKEGTDLKAEIRAELQRRLAEAKGAK